MKIAIDLTPLYKRKWTGVEMYAIDLYRALLKKKEHVIIPIFHVKNEIDNNTNAYTISQSNRLVLENIKLSKAIRHIKADITIFPIFPPPLDLYYCKHLKIVPVIHDTAFIRFKETLKFAAKYYLMPKYKKALLYSNYIVTISETSKQLLKNYTNCEIKNWGENIAKEYQSPNTDVNLLRPFNVFPNEYIISVSTIEPRKNLKYTLKVLKEYLKESKHKLVLVGRNGWGNDKELHELINSMQEYIIFTNYIPLDTLQSLYHYSYAFILLSLDEGFGRTPLEAIACGCNRIIVSDIDIFHETLGKYGNYLPLNDLKTCINKMKDDNWITIDHNINIPFNAMENLITL